MSDAAVRSELADAWTNLARRCGMTESAAAPFFQQLVVAYSEPGRFYHNLVHIANVLSILGRSADRREPELLELATWFHDAVYDPRAPDNEERSAVLAAEALGQLGLARPRIERVAALIRMTQHHRADAGDTDALLFLDADLAILGTPPDKYKDYARAIRQEYAWVPEPDYRSGRRAVLEGFLARPRIFATPAMFEEREAAARRNLAAEIAELS